VRLAKSGGLNDAQNANEEEFIYLLALPFVTPIEGADDADRKADLVPARAPGASDFDAPVEFVSCDLVEIAHNS
jgi:hypothetical protein